MSLNLVYKTPGINRIRILKEYQQMFDDIGFEVDSILWIIASLLFFVIISAAAVFIFPKFMLIGVTLGIVIVDLMLGYPYIKSLERIEKIEENLPDALKQMADTLKAGGTIEFALREVAMAEYGPLQKELMNILRKLEEGENFSTAITSLSNNVKSITVRRTVTIINESIKAGAGLAEILEEIAEDVREAHKIARERKTRTLLQVIFMFVAGAIVAPIIFGFVGTISQLLINSASSISKDAAQAEAKKAADTILLGVQVYLMAQTIAVSAMISLMREGKLSKTIIYFPAIIFMAVLAFTISGIISKGLIGA